MHKFILVYLLLFWHFPNIILNSLVCIYVQCGPTMKCELLPWSKLSTFGKFIFHIWKHWCITYWVSNLTLPLCTQAFSWSSSPEVRSQRLFQLHSSSPAVVCHNPFCFDILNTQLEEMSYCVPQNHFILLNTFLFCFGDSLALKSWLSWHSLYSSHWLQSHSVLTASASWVLGLYPENWQGTKEIFSL